MKMSEKQDRAAALVAWAESDEPTIRPDAVVERGEAARESARALLEQFADDPQVAEALARSAPGRPTLDAGGPAGTSPLWQVRAPQSLDNALRERAKVEGRSFSDVLRTAATEYLAAHT
jgi:hypothetical protein